MSDEPVRDDPLAKRIADLPPLPSQLSADDILAEARARSTPAKDQPQTAANNTVWWGLGALVAVAAAAAIVIATTPDGGPDEGQRYRGAPSTSKHAVQLQVAIDGGSSVPSGAHLTMDRAVVFSMKTSGSGTLTIAEDGVAFFPQQGQWRVEQGLHMPEGGTGVLAWQPDTPGRKIYRATFCPVGQHDCVYDELELNWRR